jgi:hypothetical protein
MQRNQSYHPRMFHALQIALLLMFGLIYSVVAFTLSPSAGSLARQQCSTVACRHSRSSSQLAVLGNDKNQGDENLDVLLDGVLGNISNNNQENDTVDFSNFNPLNYKSKRSSSAYTGNLISLRKTTMSELVNVLLYNVGNENGIQKELDEYRDFLLEPLEDSEACLVRCCF